MASDLGLKAHHQKTVVDYLRFSRYQRNQRVKTLEACFDNVKESRLSEETYTVDEVKELLDELQNVIRGELESESISSSHMNVLLLRQLFSQAEQWHLHLQADISELENRELLEKVEKFEQQEILGNTVERKEPFSPLKTTKLEPLLEGQGPVKLLQKEVNQLKEENEKLKGRLRIVEAQAFAALEEKSALKQKLTEAEQQIKDLVPEKQVGEHVEKEVLALQDEMSKVKMEVNEALRKSCESQQELEANLEATKEKLLQTQSQLELAEKDLERKFSETAAYGNMKKLLLNKNEIIKSLRKKLAGYEPADTEN